MTTNTFFSETFAHVQKTIFFFFVSFCKRMKRDREIKRIRIKNYNHIYNTHCIINITFSKLFEQQSYNRNSLINCIKLMIKHLSMGIMTSHKHAQYTHIHTENPIELGSWLIALPTILTISRISKAKRKKKKKLEIQSFLFHV